ncbi:hypothetical protein ACS0TY_003309 [Phlomoides rotata]
METGEGEAVRGVDIRNPYSEWIPVRQKPKPRYPNPRTDSIPIAARNNWIEAWKPERGCVTFYFMNFPSDCDSKLPLEKFREFVIVKDIFIPKKLDKFGKKYGFVRFGGAVNTTVVEQELNRVWVGSYKIRVNLSKFARNSLNSGQGGATLGSPETNRRMNVPEESRRGGQIICSGSECNRESEKWKLAENVSERQIPRV